jgi:predicted ATP-grasp superfamily ATP-dependent carboligase
VPDRRVLIVGSSARAAAESAAAAGFTVTALDAFGDIDQHPAVRTIEPSRVGAPFRATAAASRTSGIRTDAFVYLSGFENHPAAVSALMAGRSLWGNSPAVLRRVRDPFDVAERMRRHGFAVPVVHRGHMAAVATSAGLERPVHEGVEAGGAPVWLVKPLASGGGRRVRVWRVPPVPTMAVPTSTRSRLSSVASVPRDCYLQARVEGTPGSMVFVSTGGRAVPFGLSRQLVGEPAFGASGYRYCGSILANAGVGPGSTDVARTCTSAAALAHAVADEFRLVGVNGIDFIASGGVVHLIEVNPRWCASMELVERATGFSVFAAHVAACVSGRVPSTSTVPVPSPPPCVGKALVFATHAVHVGDSRAWLGDPDVRDVPRPGTRIRPAQPICTVFATGESDAACHAALVRRAGEIYRRVAAWRRRVA